MPRSWLARSPRPLSRKGHAADRSNLRRGSTAGPPETPQREPLVPPRYRSAPPMTAERSGYVTDSAEELRTARLESGRGQKNRRSKEEPLERYLSMRDSQIRAADDVRARVRSQETAQRMLGDSQASLEAPLERLSPECNFGGVHGQPLGRFSSSTGSMMDDGCSLFPVQLVSKAGVAPPPSSNPGAIEGGPTRTLTSEQQWDALSSAVSYPML